MSCNRSGVFVFCAVVVLFNISKTDAHGVADILGSLKDTADDIVDAAKDAQENIGDTAENVVDTIKDAQGEISDKMGDFKDKLKGHAEEMHDVLLDPFKEVMEMFKIDRMEEFTEDILEKVVDKFFGRFHCAIPHSQHSGTCQHSMVSTTDKAKARTRSLHFTHKVTLMTCDFMVFEEKKYILNISFLNFS